MTTWGVRVLVLDRFANFWRDEFVYKGYMNPVQADLPFGLPSISEAANTADLQAEWESSSFRPWTSRCHETCVQFSEKNSYVFALRIHIQKPFFGGQRLSAMRSLSTITEFVESFKRTVFI